MAGPTPIEVSGFPLGVDNTSPEYAVPTGAARSAVNVDFTKEGKHRRRRGRTKRITMVNPQSLFGDHEFPYMLVMEAGNLIAIDEDFGQETVATGYGEAEASFCMLNDEVLFSIEGRGTGRVDSMLDVHPLGLPSPQGVPALTAGSNGQLSAGRYSVALSFFDAFGEESGTCEPSWIDVPEGGSIEVTLPPAPVGIELIRVWVSEPDGTTLYSAEDIDAGESSVTLTRGLRGDETRTLSLRPLPAGHIVRELNGIIWMAVGSAVFHGKPMRPRLHHPGTDFFPFAARVDMMQPVGDAENAGMFIAAGKRTFYLSGETPSKMRIRTVRTRGAVPGSGLSMRGSLLGRSDDSHVAYWMGLDGKACVGTAGGNVEVLAGKTVMHQFERGASLAREVNGIKSVLTAGALGPIASMAASDTAEVFHYRNGILLP